MFKHHSIVISLVFSILIISAFAQSDKAQSQNENPKSIEDMSWLVGHWRANALGGVCEEVWNPPSAGRMTGTFQLAVDGDIKFYEFIILTIENGAPTMHLKHFNADLTGWEEKDKKVTFPFESMAENELLMDGMSYRLTSPDSLLVEVNIKNNDGEAKQLSFHFWRVD